jgi:acetyl esterase
MPLDPAAEMLLSLVNQPDSPKFDELSPPEARALYAGLEQMMPHEGAAVASVAARDIAGVPCLVVTPEGEGPFPVLVWFHGGGWVIGSAAESVATCRALAAKAGCVVVDVDYRLAPEHPYPAPVDDCVAVTSWVQANAAIVGGDPTRVAVGGDSAGGNLAAVTALTVPGLVLQLLVYPATDLTLTHPSIDENGEDHLLTKDAMVWFTNHYVGTADAKHPRVSPFFADGTVLAAAPPAFVLTAEYDPLRDEGEAYAARLRDAGVTVTATRYDGQIHGFFSMAAVMPVGARAVDDAAAHLRRAFSG